MLEMENLKPLPFSQGDIFVIALTLTEDLMFAISVKSFNQLNFLIQHQICLTHSYEEWGEILYSNTHPEIQELRLWPFCPSPVAWQLMEAF